jgi:hypothetical protein
LGLTWHEGQESALRFNTTKEFAMIDGATLFAWFVMAFLFLLLVWGIVVVGSLPRKIALQRNHPQVDAINAASWIGLLFGGVGWVIAFVWAFLRTEPIEHDEGTSRPSSSKQEIDRLRTQLVQLERELEQQKAQKE